MSEPDKGIYDALNKGIAGANGDVIGSLHPDDLYAHNCVLATIARAFDDPSVCAVYGDLQYVRKDDTTQVVSVLQLFSQPGCKAVHIPEVLVKMRVGGASNRSPKNIIRKSREDYKALRRSNFGVLPAVMTLPPMRNTV